MFLGVKAAVSVARYRKRNKQAGLWNQAEKQATSPLVVKKKKERDYSNITLNPEISL